MNRCVVQATWSKSAYLVQF